MSNEPPIIVPVRAPYGKVTKCGPPADYVGLGDRLPSAVRMLSSPSDSFLDGQLVTTTLSPVEDGDEGTQCLLRGKTLRSIVSFPDFPQRPVKPKQEFVELRESPERGTGCFATVDIQPGDLLVSERPLLIFPQNSSLSVEQLELVPDRYNVDETMQILLYEWSKVFDKAIESAPARLREKYLCLANSHKQDGSGLAFGISRTNAFDAFGIEHKTPSGLELSHGAVGTTLSRVNHSCRPNAVVHFHAASLSLEMYAMQAIEAGKEIFIAYCEIEDPRQLRRRALAPYGFVCRCTVCIDSAKVDPLRLGCLDIPKPPLDGSHDPALALRSILGLKNVGLAVTFDYYFYHEAAAAGFLKRGKEEEAQKYKELSDALKLAYFGRPSPAIAGGSTLGSTASPFGADGIYTGVFFL